MPPSPVIVTTPAAGQALPIVIDSPHSGTHYPADFGYSVAFDTLRKGEDLFVDELYAAAPGHGATVVCATFPRTYIDPNRMPADLDVGMLAEPWPDAVKPGPKTALGIGLIWRLARDEMPVYSRQLSAAEVRNRIEAYWRPYHQALEGAIEQAHAAHGAVWHLNVHSMPDDAFARLKLPPRPLADVVLGDLDGSTAGDEVLCVLEQSLRANGYSVARNDPYKGVEIIRKHGRPHERRHSLQIEVKRSCYADVASHAKGANFGKLQSALSDMVAALAAHVRTELQR